MKRIVVDWGSSSFRAYLIDSNGQTICARENQSGVLGLDSGAFKATFLKHCGDWLERWPDSQVLMCGMVGSRNGWQETSYIDCPTDLHALRGRFARLDNCPELDNCLELDNSPELNISIAPGLQCISPSGSPDVMRGEETQVFGALQLAECEDALVLLPGTHSKWVQVDRGSIRDFATFFTGELFALLCKQSSIGSVLPEEDFNLDEFMRGLEYSHKPGGPLHQVFSARARSLCEPDSAQALSSYLSGILIGSEFSGALDMYSPAGDCLLVAAKRLRQPYQVAGEFFKCPLQFIDPSQATARGLAAISGAELEPTPC